MKKNIDYYQNKLKGKSKMERWRIVAMVIGGIIVGFISGLFGGGGGIIIVPLLASIGKLTERESHATSIAVVFPISIICTIVYFLTGTTIDPIKSVEVTIGVILGGLIGTLLLRKLSSNVLKILFYVVMIVAGVKMVM